MVIEYHELVDAEAKRTHESLINLSGFLLRQVSYGVRIETPHALTRSSYFGRK